MTFCLGITVEDGLVGLADTRITAGNEMTTAQKLSTLVKPWAKRSERPLGW